MSRHIVTINQSSLQNSIKFEGCSECQTSCQSACKTSCTIGNLICTEQEEKPRERKLFEHGQAPGKRRGLLNSRTIEGYA